MKKRVDINNWEKEADLLGRVSHDHILKLLWTDFTEHVARRVWADPLPMPLRAGVPPQSRPAPSFTETSNPEGILVVYHDARADQISVKFGDFGLARQSTDPTTICGTKLYFAPELYHEAKRRITRSGRLGYTAAVDIWSLVW
ncbi:hypothetical protein VTI74DRAFT_1545 [Chaetomium olivicolor]